MTSISDPTPPDAREDRWRHLVACAFALQETPTEDLGPELACRLRSVVEVFDASIEPLDDFEGYAVRRLAVALVDALERSGAFGP